MGVKLRGVGALGLLGLLSGCTMVPKYTPPSVALPASYGDIGPWVAAAPADAAPRGDWWRMFNDTMLDALEARLDAQNPSLAAALARVDAASAVARQAKSGLTPTVTSSSNTSRDQVSGNRPLAVGGTQTYNERDVSVALSYELDLYGRVRAGLTAARADAAATAGDAQSLRLVLQAQLATAYLSYRGDADDIALLERTIASYQRAYDLTRVRHDGGIASGLDVNRARTQLETARVLLGDVRIDLALQQHLIAALLGEAGGAPVPAASGPMALPQVPVSAPSVLLQRRPDIAAAERRVFAANQRIGVARAALYPTITLGADGGFQSITPTLISAASGFWALGPLSTVNTLFDNGRRKAAAAQARANFNAAADDYRATVIQAFHEVDDALSQLRYLDVEAHDQAAAASAANATLDLADYRYRNGAADYLEVTTAQTTALDAARAELRLRTRRLIASVALVRATGGAI